MTSFRTKPLGESIAILSLIVIASLSIVAQRRQSGGVRPPSARPTPTPTRRPDPNTVTVAEAERRINEHVKHIEQRAGAMVAAYYYSGAQATLEASFKKAGVSTKMMSYADPWGKNGIGLFWSEYVKGFYAYHLEALNKSVANIQKKDYATRGDLEYLDKSMEAWKQYEQLFPRQFDMIVELFTKSAVVGDQKEQVDKQYGARMDQISNTKPFNAFAYDAVKFERANATRVLDERSNLIGAEIQKVKDEIARRAKEHLFTPIEYGVCVNGTERLRADQKQTKKWVLAESIEFTKGSAVYIASDKNVLKTFTKTEEVIDFLLKVTKANKAPVVKIPIKYFKLLVKQGNEITQQVGRLSAKEKQKLVDLVVKIELVGVSVDCAAVEVCENGKWVRKGFRPVGEPTQQKLPPLVKEEQGVLAGELWQRIAKHTSSYAALQERYDADPCSGATLPDQPNVTPPANEECDRLLAQIDKLKERKQGIEKTELPRANDELERARANLADWLRGLDEYKLSVSREIFAAEREVKAAEEKLKTANSRKAILEANPNAPDENTWKESLKAAAARVSDAAKVVQAAKNKVAEARDRRAKADSTTADRQATVDQRQAQINELVKMSGDVQSEIDELQKQYNACKR